jgi:NAD(P)-dependent dehydrogenase (short-subunit alcohol dehydrogenase family)
MMTGPIVLTLGAGPGIGAHTAITFAQKGFRIVSAARSMTDKQVDEQHAQFHLDLAVPEEIREVFRKTEQIFGAPPSVVIHNGMSQGFS